MNYCIFFFFKQKTAYELRISDWSSDVCSSDLFTNITLKRGFTQSRELWELRKKVIEGRTERKSGAIVLLNEAREPALRYEFIFGWPSKWMGPSLNASSSEVAIETLEIACEGIILVD